MFPDGTAKLGHPQPLLIALDSRTWLGFCRQLEFADIMEQSSGLVQMGWRHEGQEA